MEGVGKISENWAAFYPLPVKPASCQNLYIWMNSGNKWVPVVNYNGRLHRMVRVNGGGWGGYKFVYDETLLHNSCIQ